MTRRKWSLAVLLAVALAALLHAGIASAGALQVRDSASLLSASDRQAIESAVALYPFDVRVLTSSDYPDLGAFGRYVGGQVSEPNMVVIGIDPAHHHTEVHFGTGSRVAQSQWSSIERAGNPDFRQSRWGAGVIAILDAASAATGGASPPTRTSARSSAWAIGGVFLVIMLVIGLVVVVGLVMAIRWAMRAGSGGYGVQPGYDPGYGGGYGPGYGGGPGYSGGGGIGAVGGGIIGAGLGGVAGYELGKAEGEREAEERNRGGGSGFSESSSNDYGGGGGDGGGSFDAGGGGSSWDSGGDSGGGGGGDSGGGGGSDW